jgi:hypothetical protein
LDKRNNSNAIRGQLARNLIERFFNKIKQCRRVATRYDKLAANYLAFVKLASIRIWLRANESTHEKAIREHIMLRGAGRLTPGLYAGFTPGYP